MQSSDTPPSSAASYVTRLALVGGLLAAFGAAGCDNPACVFGPNGCRDLTNNGGGPGGIGSFSAVFPSDSSWIAPTAPVVVEFAPDIDDAHPESPLVVEFDQSLDPASLAGAFELLDSVTSAPVPLVDPPALIGDGRVVVITAVQSSLLQPGRTYLLRFTTDQAITDVTGQAFEYGANQDIFEYGIAATPPADPRVIFTYPKDNSTQQSDLSEFVVAFDRRMSSSSFTTNSFAVTVNGVAPVPNPTPSSLLLTGLQVPVQILQVWRWASVDANSIRQSLGASANVRVRLSPAGSVLTGSTGGTLASTDIDYVTSALRAPASVRKATTAPPQDAIGVPNLDADVVLEVTLADAAAAGDLLDVFVIGGSTANATLLKAEQRTVTLTAGVTSVILGEGDLDLRAANGDANFRDGDIEFMARLRRNGPSTVARRTDGDPSTAGFQRLVLDLTPPRLLGLGVQASSVANVTSKLAGVVIVGRGDEAIRYARVGTSLGDNFTGVSDRPRTAFYSSDGAFIAAPIDGVADVLDPAGAAVTYTVEVFDRALNPGQQAAVGVFSQIGAVGPGTALPGSSVDVRVFDADTGDVLSGALVMSHEEVGGALTSLGSGVSTQAGRATVPGAVAGETVVTVQLSGFDSFTFHGVPTSRLDVPLIRAATSLATVSGVVRSSFTADFSNTTNWLGDNRFAQPGTPLGTLLGCSLTSNLDRECSFGPLGVRAQRLGFTTFFATDPSVSAVQFNPSVFLRGYAERFASKALGYAENALDQNLTVDAAETMERIDTHLLDIGGATHFSTLAGAPVVTVEGFAYGLEGAPTLGMGVTFASGQTQWAVLGARPLAATDTGRLVTARAIEPDSYLRAELIDIDGNRIGARPRFSGSSGMLAPLDVPSFLVPGPAGSTGGNAYNIEVADVIADTLAQDGLYRVTVTDVAGHRWHLWRLDQPGSGTIRLSLPPVTPLGGTPLTDGGQTARVSVWAWPGLDRSAFLWSDIERRNEGFGHTFAVPFTQD
ncbi:MAG: Ig-like domain-containing protein [Planctomycetota bacterium]